VPKDIGAEDFSERWLLDLLIRWYLWFGYRSYSGQFEGRVGGGVLPRCEDFEDSERPVESDPTSDARIADGHVELWDGVSQSLAELLDRYQAQQVQSLLPKMYALLQHLRDAWQ
jgi:hypothetical protein